MLDGASPGPSVRTQDEAVNSNELTSLLVFKLDGLGGVDPVKQAAYATLSMPQVTPVGEPWATGAAASLRTLGWVHLASGACLVVLWLTGILAATVGYLGARHGPAPPVGHHNGTGRPWAVAASAIGTPLVLAAALGVTIAATLGAVASWP